MCGVVEERSWDQLEEGGRSGRSCCLLLIHRAVGEDPYPGRRKIQRHKFGQRCENSPNKKEELKLTHLYRSYERSRGHFICFKATSV